MKIRAQNTTELKYINNDFQISSLIVLENCIINKVISLGNSHILFVCTNKLLNCTELRVIDSNLKFQDTILLENSLITVSDIQYLEFDNSLMIVGNGIEANNLYVAKTKTLPFTISYTSAVNEKSTKFIPRHNLS